MSKDRAPATPLTVLFSPAHTLVDESHFGSDYYWAYKLIQHLALDHGLRIIALTVKAHIDHALPGVEFISVDPTGRIPVTNMDSLRFHLRCYARARAILSSGRRIDVIHHMLPFGFRTTFNPLALFSRPSDPPLVIGPLQPPYAHRGSAEWHVSRRDAHTATTSVADSVHRRRLPPLSTMIRTPVLTALSSRTLQHATALIAVSQRAAQLYGSLAHASSVSVIPIGVETDEFTPRQEAMYLADENERHVEILGCGRLVERKGFDLLIRAVAKISRAGLPVHLRLVGDGPARISLENLAQETGIKDRVTFAGAIPHDAIAAEYRRADVFCSPSFGEGFATVSLEAAASGLPIVATPAGGFRELLTHHRIGRLVPFGAVDELAAALAELVSQASLRETLGYRARQVAVHEYDWRVIASRYLDVYSQVTGKLS